MDEGSSYCGCDTEIESVPDATKITSMVTTGRWRGMQSVSRKTVLNQI